MFSETGRKTAWKFERPPAQNEGVTALPGILFNRSFVVWLLASAQSQLGSALGSLALSFLVLHQTGQAGQMAVTLACAVGPNLFGPLAGAWVDRLPLKVPLISCIGMFPRRCEVRVPCCRSHACDRQQAGVNSCSIS